jgi:hypothetical protein
MIRLFKYFLFLSLSILFSKEYFSEKDSLICHYLIMKTHGKFLEIKNYEVDVTVDLYMPAIRMPRSKYKIFYKYPDLIDIESESFGILPKAGLFESPLENFNNLSFKRFVDFKDSLNVNDVIIQGDAIFDSLKFVTPNEYFKMIDIIVDVKIDTLNWVVKNVKAEIYRRREDNVPLFEIDNLYQFVVDDFYMPTKSIAKYFIKDKKLSNWLNDENEDYLEKLTSSKKDISGELVEGKIEVFYSDYIINRHTD